jgi:enoyl-CoA hydratase
MGVSARDDLHVVKSDGVATITLNRPERRNALTPAFWHAIAQTIIALDADHSILAIVVTGSGTSFCAGFDLQGLSDESDEERKARLSEASDFASMLPPHDIPIIAAVNGPAVTGGLELCLSADVIIASSTARFADTHIKVGAIPGGGTTVFLPQRIGPGRARLMSLTGRFVDAETALEWGLCDLVVEPEALLTTAGEVAQQMASFGRDRLVGVRQLYAETARLPEHEALAHEQRRSKAWMAERFSRTALANEKSQIIAEGSSS